MAEFRGRVSVDKKNRLCYITPDTIPGCVMVAPQTLDLFVGVRILPGKKRPLRLSARTGDSQSLKRGSIPLGANGAGFHRGRGRDGLFHKTAIKASI